MSSFVLTEDAEADLAAISEFIAADDPRAALQVLDEFESAMDRLAARPLIGHLRTDLANEPVRFWSVYSYLIVYAPPPHRSRSCACSAATETSPTA